MQFVPEKVFLEFQANQDQQSTLENNEAFPSQRLFEVRS
jgi:hypothetical protein